MLHGTTYNHLPLHHAFNKTKHRMPMCWGGLTETGSGTFFWYQILSETDSKTFLGTKFFRDQFQELFPVPNFFEAGSDTIQKIQKSREGDETDTETQTDTKTRYQFRYHQIK